MKKIKLKRSLSLVLSGFMSVSLLGGANLKLNAESDHAQTVRFATREELMKSENFNLSKVDETTHAYGGKGTKAQRVYFGKAGNGQPQKWYIAGAEDDGLVLLSDPAQPLLTSPKFNSSTSSRNCDTGIGACVYVDETDTSSLSVYPNHYSSSDLRQAIKKLTTERFSEEEQGIMVSTKIYTNDTKNNKVYYNEDVLYPAYASGTGGNTIYVGENQVNSLASGISINLNALTGNNFWLRASDPGDSYDALLASPGNNVDYDNVSYREPCGVSALKIDLTSSSLIFASSAPAASSSNQFTEGNVMTFRYEDKKEKIKSNAEISDNEIKITKVDEDVDVYLYVQGKDDSKDDSKDECWVYSQPVTDSSILTADQIGHNADLSQCNVWLEYKDTADNMVYAKRIQIKNNLLMETQRISITKVKDFPRGATLHIDNIEVKEEDRIEKEVSSNVDVTVRLDAVTRKTKMVARIEYSYDDTNRYNVGTFKEVNDAGTYTVKSFPLGIDDIQINATLKNYYTLTLNQPENAKLIVKVNGAEIEGNSKGVLEGDTIETTVQVDEGKTDELYPSTIYYKIYEDGKTYKKQEIGNFHMVTTNSGAYNADKFTMPAKNVTIGAKIQKDTDITGEIDKIKSKLDEIGEKTDENGSKIDEMETKIKEVEEKLEEKESPSEDPIQIKLDKDEQTIDPKPVIAPDFAVFSGSNSGSGSGGGFVTSSVNPVTISQPMASKSLKESVEFGNKVTKTDSGSTILVDVNKIENSALTQEQKDMFKDKDAICLDLTSSGKYDKVETINYKLGKDLANREFKVYYIYDGKIQLLTESFKLDNEGNIKITSSYGASYILVEK